MHLKLAENNDHVHLESAESTAPPAVDAKDASNATVDGGKVCRAADILKVNMIAVHTTFDRPRGLL